jgi:hypothetical protein
VVFYGCENWFLIVREEHRLRVFEKRLLRRIFGPKREEVTGGWGKLHNEDVHNLYSSPIIIRIIKSKSMRWAGHVARMERIGMHKGFWWESQKERDHLENKGVGVRRQDEVISTRLIWLRIGAIEELL